MVVLYIFLGLIALILLVSFVCFMLCFYVPKKSTKDPFNFPTFDQYQAIKDTMHKLVSSALVPKFEDIYIKNSSNLKLHGRYYEVKKGNPIVILVHGYQGNAFRDFSGGLPMTLSLGYNVILIDQRAHCESEGTSLSFGIKERYDVLDWINYTIFRFGKVIPIALCGISMGAATVLMTTGLDLPTNVRCVISDSGYSSPELIIRKVCQDMKLPDKLFFPFIRLGGLIYGGFDICKTSSTKELSKCKVPVLFIHGEDDRFVPCYMTLDNYTACPTEKTLLTVPKAGHGLSFVLDNEKYVSFVKEFLYKNIEISGD